MVRDETPRAQSGNACHRGGATVLAAWVLVAAGALLARRADGSTVLPLWAGVALQLPAIVAWVHGRCAWFGLLRRPKTSSADRWITACVMAGGAVLAIHLAKADVFLAASVSFIAAALVVDALSGLYRRVERRVEAQAGLLRALAAPWLLMILAATVLLSLPLATHASVPDYRHNFWLHVLGSAEAAASAACLSGASVYSFGENYSLFGQAVLLAVTELAGLGLAAVGLAIFRPFMRRRARLRTVLLVWLGLQLAATLVLWPVWPAQGAASTWDALWAGAVHALAALWNAGWALRPDGLAGHLSGGVVYAVITSLAIVGSLGVPVILDLLLRAVPAKQDGTTGFRADVSRPWHHLSQWEAAGAFVLLIAGAGFLFYFETPRAIPEGLIPTRPVDLGSSWVALRDDMDLGRRWTMSVFVSATLRSAGMQSIPLQEGAVSWPSYGLILLWMWIGGSAGGVAGGLRTTAPALLAIGILYGRRAWAREPGGAAARRRLIGAALLFVPLWAAVNGLAVLALAAATGGSPYEWVFDGVAACNSVGLSTGLVPHLTWAGRLAIIGILIAGRGVPIVFWLRVSRRFSESVLRRGWNGP